MTYEQGPLSEPRDWASILARAQEGADAANARLRAALDDPTFRIQTEVLRDALRTRRMDIVEQREPVNAFIADIVQVKRTNPGLSDAAIQQLIAAEAQGSSDDPTATQRLQTSTLLFNPETSTYVFEVPAVTEQ